MCCRRMSSASGPAADLLETFDPGPAGKNLRGAGQRNRGAGTGPEIRQRVRQQVDETRKNTTSKSRYAPFRKSWGTTPPAKCKNCGTAWRKLLPPESRTKVRKEIDRLERMPQHSAELVVLRNYIDWMLALPWNERTEDRLDIA